MLDAPGLAPAPVTLVYREGQVIDRAGGRRRWLVAPHGFLKTWLLAAGGLVLSEFLSVPSTEWQ
jgi:hypothetical protein